MFNTLKKITSRPKPFEFYTAKELWTNEYTAKQMLTYHLNDAVDLSSRSSAFIHKSVQWITSQFNLNTGTKIADFGCGPGLYANRLAQTGASVTGIDFSHNSIGYAKQQAKQDGLAINYKHADYLTFETKERFDLIIMIMFDFCALSPIQRAELLSKYFRFLKPGGAVLMDVLAIPAFEAIEEKTSFEKNMLHNFWAKNDYYGFLTTFKYPNEKVGLDKHTIIQPSGIKTVYNWLQYFSPQSLETEFTKQGFSIQSYFEDVAGRPLSKNTDQFAVIATKP